MSRALVYVLLGIAIAAVVALWTVSVANRRRTAGREARAWARDRQVPETSGAMAVVDRYLIARRSLRWRLAVLAIAAPTAWALVRGDGFVVRVDLYPILAAYLVGTLWAELRLTRPRGPVPRASLVARRLEAYLSPGWLHAQRLVAVAAAAAWLAVLRVPPRPAGDVQVPSATACVVAASAALLLGVATEVVERQVVQRPQPDSAADLIAADDAVRSSSVHALAGAATAAAATLGATTLLVRTDGSAGLVLVIVVLALGAWRACAQADRRTTRRRTGVAAVVVDGS